MVMLLIVLAVVIGSLWQQIRGLRDRIEMLEHAGVNGTVADASPWSQPAASLQEVAEQDLETAVPPEPELDLVVTLSAGQEPWATVTREQPAAEADLLTEGVRRVGGAGFEDIFGRRLPIWAGGVTLAVAGFLIVKYSIQAGLLSPLVRVVLGMLFGGGLIGGAEAALRREVAVRDPRVRQALAGAGIATLYATVLAAANLYDLVDPAAAFVGMALITALAGGLSIRFGAPSAVLGLVGGLAAPALVGATQPNVPLLTLYLALAVGGLCALGRQQRWWWLGAAALAGGFGWGSLLILGGALDFADALSVGFYTLALAIGLPLLLVGERGKLVQLAGSVLGCAQLAALVAVGGFAPLHWALFGLISVAIVWLSRREALFADVPAFGVGVAILLAFAWPAAGRVELGLVLAGMTVIYAAPAALRLWRDDWRLTDAPIVAAVALAIGVLPLVHFTSASFAAVIGAGLAGGIAALGWRSPTRRQDARFATLAIVAAVLLGMAGMEAVGTWTWAPMVAVLAAGLHLLSERAEDRRVEWGGWTFAVGTLVLLACDQGLERLAGQGVTRDWTGLATWAVPALVAAWLAWRSDRKLAWPVQSMAVLIGYGAAAQLVPTLWLPVIPVVVAIGLALTRRAAVLPASAAAAALMAAWAAEPLGYWLLQGMIALTGMLVPIHAWPVLGEAALRLALPGAALLLSSTLLPLPSRLRDGVLVAAGIGLMVAGHLAYKHLFAIDDGARFVAHAMKERTLWEMLLAAIAAGAWIRGARRIAIALAAASLLHLAWFTGFVANPLIVEQDVGVWLLLAYATGVALIWAAPRAVPNLGRQRDWALMALIGLGAFSLLREAAHSPMHLSAGTGEGEQIARSVLALALAGGFLCTGIVRHARDWRIASLGLMLVAVVKVFLFDAAGLDGIARIASFAALGFSLIGVGWLYSRYLPDEAR